LVEGHAHAIVMVVGSMSDAAGMSMRLDCVARTA
jgi:hypothetical protein